MIKPATYPHSWTRQELETDTSWILELSDEQIADFEQATQAALASGKSMFEMTREDFPIGAAARAALDAVVKGTQDEYGLKLLRGFPVDRHDDDAMRMLWWGIGLQMGVARPQGKQSQFMSDVTNAGGTYRAATGRGYNTNSALDFHADGCDVVGLFCLRTAKSGGSSLISSSMAAHNEMLKTRPDLVEVLYEPFVFSRQGEEAPEEPPYYQTPIFGVKDGRFACRHVRNHIKGALISFPDVAQLSAKQTEALDLFDATLARADLCFHTFLQRGDMQFLNNYVVLHSRTEYEDFPEPERRRHLLRLWLSLPEGQPLPDAFQVAVKDVEPRAVRGGFRGINITPEVEAFEERLAEAHAMRFRIYDDRQQVHRGGATHSA
jgi:hypothetical protein